MGIFTKKIGPVFLKEESDSTKFVNNMQELKDKATGELAQKIENQINIAKYGELGENNIAFELKNSGIDMYILHDIYFENNGLSAQIDYILITRKHIYIIECKNLIGNIEIDSTGAFIRTFEIAGKRIKEGIYSPITQNQRHLQVMKAIRQEYKSNIISKMVFEKNFEEKYKPIVVLANPKTCLNAKFAKKDVKEQVIRADQLIKFIKDMDLIANGNISIEEMNRLANYFLDKNIPERSDYSRKYKEMFEEVDMSSEDKKNNTEIEKETEKEIETNNDIKEDDNRKQKLISELKKFRLEQSRKENVKPYFIFNDAQMEDLINKNPKTKDELLKVSGFGNVKVEKYGDKIIEILCS